MTTKIPVAQKRLFGGIYVCKKCKKKVRSQSVRILAGKVKCPRCDGKSFRTIKKK